MSLKGSGRLRAARVGGGGTGSQGQGSEDIYLVRYATRRQLFGILAAVKLLKTVVLSSFTSLISQSNR